MIADPVECRNFGENDSTNLSHPPATVGSSWNQTLNLDFPWTRNLEVAHDVKAAATGWAVSMAAPVFLSYHWIDGTPPEPVEILDREMRLRGVPVWRDVREFSAGARNEDVASEAIRNLCCGCVLYFTEAVLDSWFIKGVELAAARNRVERDDDFFVTAIFDGVGSAEAEILREEIGLNPGNYQGLFLDRKTDTAAQIRPFSAQILHRYLSIAAADATVVALDTWNEIPLAEQATLHLNWAGENLGTGPLPIEWELLKPATTDVEAALRGVTDARVLHVGGNVHLSAAFLLGYSFREPTGWTIEARHARAPVEITSVEADPQGWRLNQRPAQNDSHELLAQVCASAECGHAVHHHRTGKKAARVELGVFPPNGKPERTSLENTEINSLAAAIVAAIRGARERYSVSSTELYLAGPWTLALAFGWSFASSGAVTVHEATAAKDTYHPNPLRLP
jgi:hypothetical protein